MATSIRDKAIEAARAYLPRSARDWIVAQQRRYRINWPRTGTVNFGDLRRTAPISPIFGMDRGMPVDRYYIEAFLEANQDAIAGRVLELGDSFYTNKFGGDRVTHKDVLHVVAGNPEATIVADLTHADHIDSDLFDCIIFTQSLQMIYDLKAALRTLHRILKPGGTVLITSAGMSKIARRLGRDDWGEYWHLTTQSMQFLADELFPGAQVKLGSYGNVLSAVAYLHGLAAHELEPEELAAHEEDIELLVTARITKGQVSGR